MDDFPSAVGKWDLSTSFEVWLRSHQVSESEGCWSLPFLTLSMCAVGGSFTTTLSNTVTAKCYFGPNKRWLGEPVSRVPRFDITLYLVYFGAVWDTPLDNQPEKMVRRVETSPPGLCVLQRPTLCEKGEWFLLLLFLPRQAQHMLFCSSVSEIQLARRSLKILLFKCRAHGGCLSISLIFLL